MTGRKSHDAIVIGGGLHGCSTLMHLALRGMRAVLIEKDYIGRHASGVNAGGVRRLGRHLAEIPLAVASAAIWPHLTDLIDDDCGFEAPGQVKVAETETELDTLAKRAAQVRALGFDHEEMIGQAELRELIPSIAPHCVGALIVRGDGAAHPYRTVLAFARKAVALGQTIRQGERVHTIRREGDIWTATTDDGHAGETRYSAPCLINAGGAWAATIAAMAGEPVPLEITAPMLMITERVEPFLSPVLGAAGRKLSFKQYGNGTVLIGGGHMGEADAATNRTALDWRRLATSATTVCTLFPQLKPVRIVRAWAGIEARMPDDIPVIGPSGTAEGLIHQFGFSAHGFQLGPAVGRIVADLAATGRTDLPIAAFSIGRFRASSTRPPPRTPPTHLKGNIQ